LKKFYEANFENKNSLLNKEELFPEIGKIFEQRARNKSESEIENTLRSLEKEVIFLLLLIKVNNSIFLILKNKELKTKLKEMKDLMILKDQTNDEINKKMENKNKYLEELHNDLVLALEKQKFKICKFFY
jgi:hypothetical protein